MSDMCVKFWFVPKYVQRLFDLACSRLSDSGGLKKRPGDGWGLVGKKAEPACRPLAFSIVLTDREPGTGSFDFKSKPRGCLIDDGKIATGACRTTC